MQGTETDTDMIEQKKKGGIMEKMWGSPSIQENRDKNRQCPAALEGYPEAAAVGQSNHFRSLPFISSQFPRGRGSLSVV